MRLKFIVEHEGKEKVLSFSSFFYFKYPKSSYKFLSILFGKSIHDDSMSIVPEDQVIIKKIIIEYKDNIKEIDINETLKR